MSPKPHFTHKRAQEVIQSLIEGVDPRTKEPVSSDSVLNHPDVLRALIAANMALETVMVREARRAQLPSNVGRPWTQDEEATLAQARKENMPVQDIAAMHGRTVRSIESRLVRLGLLRPSERTTGDSFFAKKAKHK